MTTAHSIDHHSTIADGSSSCACKSCTVSTVLLVSLANLRMTMHDIICCPHQHKHLELLPQNGCLNLSLSANPKFHELHACSCWTIMVCLLLTRHILTFKLWLKPIWWAQTVSLPMTWAAPGPLPSPWKGRSPSSFQLSSLLQSRQRT